MAAAVHSILVRNSRECTDRFFVDEDVLTADGVLDFLTYSTIPGAELLPDIFLDE